MGDVYCNLRKSGLALNIFGAGADQFSSDRRGADFSMGVPWCANKELTKHCLSSTTIVSYDLVVAHNKSLQYYTWAFN